MATEHQYQSRVRWAGTQDLSLSGGKSYTRDLIIEPAGKPIILGSSGGAFDGDDTRYNPEDLMLASLCLLTYLAIVAKAAIPLVSLEVSASGVLAMVSGKMRFREATLVPVTRVARSEDVERATQLHESAHRHCFMSSSVNFPIAVIPTVTE